MSNTKLAKETLLNYLENGIIERTQRKEITKDSKGNILSEKITVFTHHKPCPEWVIERILSEEIAELEALRILIDNGWLKEEKLTAVCKSITEFSQGIREIVRS